MLVLQGALALVLVNFSKVYQYNCSYTVLRTSISTSACKGLSIVLTIGAHVCKGLSIVFMVIVVFC